MKPNRLSFGMAVRAARQAARLSLSDISEQTGISVSAWSRVENGLRSLDVLDAITLLQVLNVDLQHLMAVARVLEEQGVPSNIQQQRSVHASLRAIQSLAVLTAIESLSDSEVPEEN